MSASAWTSNLSVAEFAAVRSVGFEPVGQVLGTTVTQFGYDGPGGCSTYQYGAYRTQPQYRFGARYTVPQAEVIGTGATRSSPWYGYGQRVQALYTARRRVIARLVRECQEVGGDGIVGVRLARRPFPGSFEATEMQAIGTAVRSTGTRHRSTPFVTDLSGQDFAKLMLAGWVPCGLVFGVAIGVRHDDWRTRSARRSWSNVEIPGYTDLVQKTREQVRKEVLADLTRHGGEGMTLRGMRLEIRERECDAYGGGGDHIAEASLVGTALVRFHRTDPPPESHPLVMMPLDESHPRVIGHAGLRRGRP